MDAALMSRKLDLAVKAARELLAVLEAQASSVADGDELDKDAIRDATEKASHASQRLTDYSAF